MLRRFCRSKLHQVRVTGTNIEYEGSITIDMDLVDKAGMYPGEMVHVFNVENGERLETYIIPGRRGSREVSLNGAAARKAEIGDRLLVLSEVFIDEKDIPKKGIIPRVIRVDDENNIISDD
ncbi:MAG: aspartate 1-decarboxylase [bacterium]